MLNKDSHLSDDELLAAADGELTARRQREIRAHLEACWSCRTRMAELESAIGSFVTSYRSVFDPQLPPEDGAIARFQARLTQRVPGAVNSWWRASAASAFATLLRFRWATLVLPLLLVLMSVGFFSGGLFQSARTRILFSSPQTPVVPDPRLTPGEAALVSKTEVCEGNAQSEQPQHIPEALKQAVLAEYGLQGAPQGAYEVDFLITPELGGSTSIRNLWPQAYLGRTWNAHVKDALEERLHTLVCRGDLDLSTAQREIATNWVDAYKKYLRTDNPN